MKRELLQKKYIETVADIIKAEGVDAVTTRRIAKEMHCNAANTYYYFRDLEELIAYAGMEFFAQYLTEISGCYADAENALEAYQNAWRCLIRHSSQMPQLYEKFLYGKYGGNLGRICFAYYQLFPNKYLEMEPFISNQIVNVNFNSRLDHLIIGRCVEEDWFTDADANILAELMRWLHQGLLNELISERITVTELEKKFFMCMERMIAAFRQK